MKRIVLIYPPLGSDAVYGVLARAGTRFAPQGLASLASVLIRNGHEVRIIDAHALEWDIDKTLKAAVEFGPDLVGLSFYSVSAHVSGILARGIKAAIPRVKVIGGGGHISSFTTETMNAFPDLDAGVMGEGELTLTELVDSLDHKDSWAGIPGLAFRNGEELVQTRARPLIQNLDTLPDPAWELLPSLASHYWPGADAAHRLPAFGITTSRGCPGRCKFCGSVFGRRFRPLSAPMVLSQMIKLHDRFHINDIQFQDETFAHERTRVLELCELLAAKDTKDLTWSCYARADELDSELLGRMKKAGCWQVAYGIESGDQEVLDAIGKDQDIEQVKEVMAATRRAGIRVRGLFMIGAFGETPETAQKTLKLIRTAPMDDFHITFFTPLPGTPSWTLAPGFGTMDTSWERMAVFDSPAFVPRGLNLETLKASYKKAYRAFYLRPGVIFDHVRRLIFGRARKRMLGGLMGFISLAAGCKKGSKSVGSHNRARYNIYKPPKQDILGG